MAFTFAAFCYMLSLVLCAALIFFAIWHIIAFDELRTDFKSPIDQCNPLHARERLRNIERICFLLRKLVLPEYSIHSLFCIMFLCAQEWLTLGLNVPLLFYHFWRYFHCPADSSELAYDPPVVMNADTLSYCQKEAWCKLAFYLLSFFYYLYWVLPSLLNLTSWCSSELLTDPVSHISGAPSSLDPGLVVSTGLSVQAILTGTEGDPCARRAASESSTMMDSSDSHWEPCKGGALDFTHDLHFSELLTRRPRTSTETEMGEARGCAVHPAGDRSRDQCGDVTDRDGQILGIGSRKQAAASARASPLSHVWSPCVPVFRVRTPHLACRSLLGSRGKWSDETRNLF
ncbi:hypothetical protein E5288_WYG005003 [Bos mutus]|uniref:Protein cornichon-like protein 3 n=1 Tax=Bos mutus TaxID=72004 RepID=A0A6B0QXQ4_9CETA|nr:hypothetical protein [Bos mutus]